MLCIIHCACPQVGRPFTPAHSCQPFPLPPPPPPPHSKTSSYTTDITPTKFHFWTGTAILGFYDSIRDFQIATRVAIIILLL